MASRTGISLLLFIACTFTRAVAQDPVADTIEQAKVLYLQGSYKETSEQLVKALQLVNEQLLEKLKKSFPKPEGGWRANEAIGNVAGMSFLTGLNAKRSYFKQGGGPSIDIEIVTNSVKIGNIKMLFASPSMIHRAGENLKISTVANRTCLEKYDPVDRYAELTFAPTSTLMITIIGQEMKNADAVIQYAGKIDWDELEKSFP